MCEMQEMIYIVIMKFETSQIGSICTQESYFHCFVVFSNVAFKTGMVLIMVLFCHKIPFHKSLASITLM